MQEKGSLHEFKIYEKNNYMYVKFTFERENGELFKNDEMLLYQKDEDISFLKAIEEYVYSKLEKSAREGSD